MLQAIDLESLVCSGGDEKVACESSLQNEIHVSVLPARGLDSPPASYRLPIKDGIDWIDFTAATFLDRDDSTKEITNPKSVAHQSVSGNLGNPRANSSSQRFSGKPKVPIIALPNKLRHSDFLGQSRRRAAVYPKKGQKRALPESEPTSPKVSCFGRVLSERDRTCRRRKTHVASYSSPLETSSISRKKRSRIWFVICKLLCFGRKKKSPAVDDGDGELPSDQTANNSYSSADLSRRKEYESAVPGLGAMKRLASGRRSGFMDEERDHSEYSGPLIHDEGVLRLRMAGSLQHLDCYRSWKDSGPATV